MADDVRVTNWPNGGSGSVEAVALELWKMLRHSHGRPGSAAADLASFDQCLLAARGYDYDASKLSG